MAPRLGAARLPVAIGLIGIVMGGLVLAAIVAGELGRLGPMFTRQGSFVFLYALPLLVVLGWLVLGVAIIRSHLRGTPGGRVALYTGLLIWPVAVAVGFLLALAVLATLAVPPAPPPRP
jgi:hypothetical protein